MADMIMINPSSGDKTASLFTGPDSSEAVLETVSKASIMKLVGTSGNYYNVEYNNKMKNLTYNKI